MGPWHTRRRIGQPRSACRAEKSLAGHEGSHPGGQRCEEGREQYDGHADDGADVESFPNEIEGCGAETNGGDGKGDTIEGFRDVCKGDDEGE